MNRRGFLRTGCVVALSAGLAGCSGLGSDADTTTAVAAADDVDVTVAVVRNAPENPGPYEDPAGTVAPQESEALALEGIVLQRAGQQGLVVAGDAVNVGDRPLADLTVEVTLYDENTVEDEIFDSASERTGRDRLAAGDTWQWAATFGDEPEFQIDYYAVVATASYA